MNLFLLNIGTQECVVDLCDKHIVKMILETAQILYSVWHARAGLPNDETLEAVPAYRKTHVNHPTCVWARATSYHYEWTCMYGIIMCKEYTHRYGKVHKTQYHLERLYSWGFPPKVLEEPVVKKKSKVWIKATSGIPAVFDYFPLCMDEDSYVKDNTGKYNAVMSYRKYYQTKQDKFKMAWKTGEIPNWFQNFKQPPVQHHTALLG